MIIATAILLYLLDFIVKNTRMGINMANYYLVGRPDKLDLYNKCEELDFLFRFTLTPIKDLLVSLGLIFLFRHLSGLDKTDKPSKNDILNRDMNTESLRNILKSTEQSIQFT